MSGAAGGQLIALVAAPALSRLYSPGDFGTYTVILALSSVVATVATLRFDLAVPIPESDSEAHSLVALGLASTGVTAILGLTVVAISGGAMARKFGQPDLMPWLWAVPLTAAVMGAYLVLNQLAVRNRRYGAIGRRNLLQSSILVTTQVTAGLVNLRPGGLVLGLALGQTVGTMSLLLGSGIRSPAAKLGRRTNSLKAAISRYRRFPLVLTPSGLCNVMGLQLPILIIAFYYGDEVAGWLGLSQRVLALPVTLIGAAAAQVYLGELVNIRDRSAAAMTSHFMLVTRRLVLVGLAAMTVLLIAGPWLFSWVFGPEWSVSGEYGRALSIGLAAQLVGAPLSQTLTAFERQYLQLAWDVGRLALVAGTTTLAATLGASALTAVWCFSATSALAYIASWMLSRMAVRGGYRRHRLDGPPRESEQR